MPDELVRILAKVLDSAFESRLAHSPDGRVQLTLHGLPDGLLEDLFRDLTADGRTNHAIPGVSGESVLVLLVTPNPAPRAPGVTALTSHETGWEGVVFARNSWPRVLVLCSELSWGTVPESVENATEPLGPGNDGSEPRLGRAPIWALVLDEVCSNYELAGVSREGFQWAIKSLLDQSVDFPPLPRRELPWATLRRLASVPASAQEFYASVGIPERADGLSEVKDLRDAYDTLDDVAAFVGKKGLEDSFGQFRGTTTGGTVVAALDDFKRAIQSERARGFDFVEAPLWIFRAAGLRSSWERALTWDILVAILAELDQAGPKARASLSCTNALNRPEPLEGEPVLVLEVPEFEVSDGNGVVTSDATVVRGIGPAASRLTAPTGSPPVFTDPGIPQQERRVRYIAESPTLSRSRPLYLISLSRFRCHATARVADATANKPPALETKTKSWRQRIVLPISGVTQVEILHDPVWQISAVEFKGETLTASGPETPERAVFIFKSVDDGDTAQVSLRTVHGAIGGWRLEFTIDRNEEILPRSALEALVAAHQHSGRIPQVAPVDNLLRDLEGRYMGSAGSWRPVLAGWSDPKGELGPFDWAAPVLGDLAPFPNIHRPAEPPEPVLQARETVRTLLQASALRVPEIEFCDPRWSAAISAYVGAYVEWFNRDPASAIWFDLVVIFAALENRDAGRFSPTQEPVAVLLSPLHPLRAGWRSVADGALRGSLSESPRPCPAAGLVDPYVIPDSLALPLSHGSGAPRWRAFFSAGSNEVSWGLLFNRRFIGETDPARRQVQAVLDWLGLRPRSMAGGFSPSQAVAALGEVVDILPARSTLRVGIAGGKGLASSSVAGIAAWARSTFAPESLGVLNPAGLEVHDARSEPESPTPGELTDLYDQTHERVQWFRHPNHRLPVACDLVVLDQLGFTEPEGTDGAPRTPCTADALTRVRVKEDSGEARFLTESRVLRPVAAEARAASPIGSLCGLIEELTPRDDEVSQLRYHPNQEALGERLSRSTFLAVSSTRLDPACLIRGAQGRSGHLWDYALPSIVSTEDEGSGYYLIAQPTAAMRRSVTDATRVLGPGPAPSADELLAEASHRGIPVLKRLAAGGAESRGELGLLLAVRLLQDCFRAPHGRVRVPPITEGKIGLVIPVDPYASLFAELGSALRHPSRSRPDLILAQIDLSAPNRPSIDLVPIEIKFRTNLMGPGELDEALKQASGFAPLLKLLWEDPLPSRLWTSCSRTVLANILDEAFRVYADGAVHGQAGATWRQAHEAVLDSVMTGAATIRVVATGRLLALGGWPLSGAADIDRDGLQESLHVSNSDCAGLLAHQPVSADLEEAFNRVFAPPPKPGPRASAGTTAGHVEPEDPVAPISTPPLDTRLDAVHPTVAEPLVPVAAPATLNHDAMPSGPEPLVAVPAELGVTVEPEQDIPVEHPVDAAPPGGNALAPRVPQVKRDQVAAGFAGFVGNREAIRTLTRDLLKALMEAPPHLPKNFLFTGSPSTGKTELARRVARILGFPFVRVDGRGLINLERLTELLDNVLTEAGRVATPVGRDSGLPAFDYPSSIVFVDEVHLVPRAVQEGLLLVLERNDRRGILRDRVVLMNRVTFLFATTRASELDRAFKSRCVEVPLEEYTVDEVAEMISLKHPGWDVATYTSLAVHGRLVPRIALELADTLVAELEVAEDPTLPLVTHLQTVLDSRQIFDLGVTPPDLEYLRALSRQDRPVGEAALLGYLNAADPARVVEEIEPFLARLGFIKRGRAGREILPAGRGYLAEWKRKHPS